MGISSLKRGLVNLHHALCDVAAFVDVCPRSFVVALGGSFGIAWVVWVSEPKQRRQFAISVCAFKSILEHLGNFAVNFCALKERSAYGKSVAARKRWVIGGGVKIGNFAKERIKSGTFAVNVPVAGASAIFVAGAIAYVRPASSGGVAVYCSANLRLGVVQK